MKIYNKLPDTSFVWRIVLFSFFFSISIPVFSQSLYEIEFSAERIKYKGFLVYFNEEDAYMRVAYTANGVYNVVQIDYNSTSGKEDGYNYFVMEGRNARFITTTQGNQSYNPDHFVWVGMKKQKEKCPS